jgi:hypothetical protein
MAVNKHPWIRNIFGAASPLIMHGKVQAGSTQAIKRGEICVYNETSGYWVPANAAADYIYSLAIANEEQKAADLERYMEFIAIRDGDVFEFALDAAAQVEVGNGLELTSSDSQTLTLDVDGNAVATVVGFQNYPDAGTTLRNISYAEVAFLPEFSYLYKNIMPRNLKKIIVATAAITLKMEDCGAIVTNKGAGDTVVITAPGATVPVGWWFTQVCGAAQAFRFDPKPDTAKCIIKGGIQTAGKYVGITEEADFIDWVWDGTDWIGFRSISGADDEIDVEG